MQSVKPKKKLELTAELIEYIQRYYNLTAVSEVFEEAKCFSEPSILSHACNALALLPGEQKCLVCKHDPLQLCDYTCHISKFCLAAYAWRLGVGGDVLVAAMKRNLKLRYAELLHRIETVLGPERPERAVGVVKQRTVEPVTKIPNPAEECTPLPSDLLTITLAAREWQCTVANISLKVSGGSLRAYKVHGRKLVSKAELLRLKSMTKRS